MTKKSKFVLILLFVSSYSYSQFSRNSWKRQRKELYFGVGASNFLGDLGGKDGNGKDYSYSDLELSMTRPSFSLGYKYRISRTISWRSDLNYLYVSGSDALTTNIFRKNRNLSFKSNIFEISTSAEYALYLSKLGNRYGIRSARSRYKSSNQSLYFSGGIGLFYFNPKSEYQGPDLQHQGKWFALQPLGTEGQGLPGAPTKYSRFSVCVPIVIGYRIGLGRNYTLGVEYNFRKTFTDYIDDVHGVYYDNTTIAKYNGNVAAYFADPNIGIFPTAGKPDSDGTPAQRGDKQMDSYMSIQVKLGMILKSRPRRRVSRAKF